MALVTSDESMTVIILDERETEALTTVMGALGRLYIGPMRAGAAPAMVWPSLASLVAALEADGDE